MNGDDAPEPVQAFASPSPEPPAAAPPLPGQPGYNWVLHGDSHPDLAAILWPMAEAIRTVRNNQEILRRAVDEQRTGEVVEALNGRMTALEQKIAALGKGQDVMMRLLKSEEGFVDEEGLGVLREAGKMGGGEPTGGEEGLRREITELKAQVEELEKSGKALKEGMASGREQVMDRLHDLDSQIDELKTNILTEVRDLRISATEHRLWTSQDVAILQSQVEEFWRHLTEAGGLHRGPPRLASQRKEYTMHEAKSVRHWVDKMMQASRQTGREAQNLRRCREEIEFLAGRRAESLSPADRAFMLDGGPRIGFLQRSVKWLRECYEAIRQSEERFAVSKATVPSKRRALD